MAIRPPIVRDSENLFDHDARRAIKELIAALTNLSATVAAIQPGTGTGTGITDGDKGDITVSGSGTAWDIDAGVVGTAELANSSVTLAKMATVSTARFLARITAGTGNPEALTGTQATTLLDVFSSTLQGLVPPSGGGSTTWLRADGTFAAPYTAAGWVSDGSDGNVTISADTTLARDMFYDALTVNAGKVLTTGSYGVYCRSLINNGAIANNGGPGGNAANDSGVQGTTGTAVAAAFYGSSGVGGSPTGGSSAAAPRGFGAGFTAGPAGPSAGNNGSSGANGLAGGGGAGGAGGAAAAGLGGDGGSSGTATLSGVTFGDIRVLSTAIAGIAPRAGSTSFTCGTGGGLGGSGNTAGGPGGAGGGGGYVMVVAGSISGSGTIEAHGGNGGNGSSGTTGNNCGGGGGGGGGGGIAVVVIGSGSFPTTSVAGGFGGSGGAGFGTGKNGGAGGNGGDGLSLQFRLF